MGAACSLQPYSGLGSLLTFRIARKNPFGGLAAAVKDHETALSAMSLNASCATALYFGALIYAFAGQPAAAISNANRALRLNPFDPFAYFAYGALGGAAIQEARYDEAAPIMPRQCKRISALAFVTSARPSRWPWQDAWRKHGRLCCDCLS